MLLNRNSEYHSKT